jgi:phospholipid-translocating ATPase
LGGKAYKFVFNPSDLDRVRYLYKLHPEHDFRKDREAGGVQYIKRAVSTSRGVKRKSIITHGGPRSASRTDMSTGLRSRGTGFDFSMEENGVALRRLQSNLSGANQPAGQHKRRRSILQSISRTIRRKKVPSTVPEESEEPRESKPHLPKAQ